MNILRRLLPAVLLLASSAAHADMAGVGASTSGRFTTLYPFRATDHAIALGHVTGVEGDLRAVAISEDGSLAAVATVGPSRLHVVDLDNGVSLGSYELPGTPEHVTFAAHGRRVAAAIGSELLIFDSLGAIELHRVRLLGGIAGLASTHLDRTVTLPRGDEYLVTDEILVRVNDLVLSVDAVRGDVTGDLGGARARSLAVIPGGIALLHYGTRLTRFDLATETVLGQIDVADWPAAWAPSIDGSVIASADGRFVRVHDGLTGAELPRIELDDVDGVIVPGRGTSILYSGTAAGFPASALSLVLAGSGDLVASSWSGAGMMAGWWVPDEVDTEWLEDLTATRASQSSVDSLASQVGTRASQSSVDGLAAQIATRSSQASVDALSSSVATRSSQSSVDALAGDVATRASQSSVDALAGDVATRASQSSVDAVAADVATRSSQASVDEVATDVDAVAGDVDDLSGEVAERASQASVDALTADVGDVQSGVDAANGRLDARLDAPVSSRATQDSVNRLEADLATLASDTAADHELLLSLVDGGSRSRIEASLAAGLLQPLFLIPAGPGGDPAALGLTCPGLAPAGHPGVDDAGLFETIRCVTRRALDDLAAIGEDVRRAEADFADAESDRLAAPPRYRDAAEGYSSALQQAMRGH